MSQFTQVVSPLQPGAGRIIDCMWPDPYDSTFQKVIRMRNGPTATADRTTANTGLGGGTVDSIAVYKGVDALVYNCTNAAAGTKSTFGGPGALHVRTTKGFLPSNQTDDLGFMRVIVRMASAQTPATLRDFGMQITQAATGCIYRDGASGFGFNIDVSGGAPIIDFVVRGPNGLLHHTGGNLAAIDTTLWHDYEIRIQSATQNGEATMTPFIDGVAVTGLPATTLSWAAGTDLPASTVTGSSLGFQVVFVSDANANAGLATTFGGVRIQMCPSVNFIF